MAFNRCEDCRQPCDRRAKRCRDCAGLDRRRKAAPDPESIDPTPAEIQERCAAIQAEWTEADRLTRARGVIVMDGKPRKRKERIKDSRVREIRHKLHCPLAPDDLMIELFS